MEIDIRFLAGWFWDCRLVRRRWPAHLFTLHSSLDLSPQLTGRLKEQTRVSSGDLLGGCYALLYPFYLPIIWSWSSFSSPSLFVLDLPVSSPLLAPRVPGDCFGQIAGPIQGPLFAHIVTFRHPKTTPNQTAPPADPPWLAIYTLSL